MSLLHGVLCILANFYQVFHLIKPKVGPLVQKVFGLSNVGSLFITEHIPACIAQKAGKWTWDRQTYSWAIYCLLTCSPSKLHIFSLWKEPHANSGGRTRKFHTEKSKAKIQTQDLLVVRCQCWIMSQRQACGPRRDRDTTGINDIIRC